MTTTETEFREKLESAHEFPCDYTFKLFGPNEQTFADAAQAVVQKRLPGVTPEVSARVGSKSGHQCLTMVLPVADAQQVIDLYADFHKIDGLKMLM